MLEKKPIFSRIIFYLTAVLMFLPLIVWGGSSYPFIYPKVIWLQALSSVIFLVYLFLVFYNFRQYRPNFSWLGLAVVLFYGAMVASLFFGNDFNRILWSRSERMLGIFQMVHYLLLFLVWRSVFSRKDWRQLWQWFVGIGGVASIVSLVQVVAPQFLYNIGAARVAGTLGNPIYVAGFCLFLLFSAAIFFYESESKIVKIFWAGHMTISILALLATKTRGDFVGLWAGLIFLSVVILFTKSKQIFSTKVAKYTLLVLVVLPLALYGISHFSWSKNIPILNRFFISSVEESTSGTRLIMWKMAYVSWQQKPWLGWGWDNFYQAANQNYLPELLRYGHGEEWTDNAHNVVMNLLATVGVVGLFFYLAIYGVLFLVLGKNYSKSVNDSDKILPLILMSFLVAHFVQNLFVFENLSSYLFFFWILAGLDIMNMSKSTGNFVAPVVSSSGILRKVSKVILEIFKVIVLLLCCLFVYVTLYRFTYIPAKADIISAQAVRLAFTDFQGAINMHRQAVGVKLNPYQGDIAFEFGQFILVWMDGHPDFASSKYRGLAMDMYAFGIKAISAYLSNHPDDPRAWNLLGLAYLDGYPFWQDLKYLDMAENVYLKSLEYSPKRQTLLFGLVRTELAKNKMPEAKKYSQQALDLDKNIGESHWLVALVCVKDSQGECGYTETKEAIKFGYNLTQQELSLVFATFKQHNDIGHIEPIIQSYLSKVNSQNYNHQLFSDYIQYLKDNKRDTEAQNISLKLNQ